MTYDPNHLWQLIEAAADRAVPARRFPPRGSRDVPASSLGPGDVLPDIDTHALRVVALGAQPGCVLVYVAPADAPRYARRTATRRLRYAPEEPVRVTRSAYLPAEPEEA